MWGALKVWNSRSGWEISENISDQIRRCYFYGVCEGDQYKVTRGPSKGPSKSLHAEGRVLTTQCRSTLGRKWLKLLPKKPSVKGP